MQRTVTNGAAYGSMWRAIVVIGAIAATVAATAALAHGLPVPEDRLLAAGRGLLIAATAAASLLGSAWAMRRGFVAAGLPAGESLVPPRAPEALRAAGERIGRSRRLAVAGALVVGLVLGLLGGRLAGPGAGGIFDRGTVELASEHGDAARGERVAGARSEAAGRDEGVAADGEGGPSDPSGGAEDSSGDDAGAGPSNGDESGGDSGESPKKPGATTTTTAPKGKSPVGVVCEALEDYSGDVDDLLAAVGLGSTSQMTKAACDEIEDILANPVDEIDDVIDDLVGKLPVTTTTITVPITLPPVTTTTITVPITLPPVTTTTITLPLF